jgi:hypothetical protein
MKKSLTIISCVVSTFCMAQNKTFDLSKNIKLTETVNPQTITSLTLVNSLAIPGTVYSIDVIVKHTPTPPLPSLSIPGAGPAGLLGIPACTNLEAAITKLKNETDESKIPSEVEALQKEIKNAVPATCGPDIDEAKTTIDATTTHYSLPFPIIIGKGDEVTITITRDKKKWVFVFKNERVSHWTTYYGFTYIPDVLTKFSNYYASEQAGGTFNILKMNSTNKNVLQNISPTAMFTYRFFEKNPDAFMKFGITGGIMYNTDILGAMFGPSLVFGDNITINTGVSFVQKYKLKGQYTEGQIVQDNLDFSQLHDKIWTYDMFFSIGFNLPELFSKKSDKSSSSGSEGNSEK